MSDQLVIPAQMGIQKRRWHWVPAPRFREDKLSPATLSFLNDITKRNQDRRLLRQSEEQYREERGGRGYRFLPSSPPLS